MQETSKHNLCYLRGNMNSAKAMGSVGPVEAIGSIRVLAICLSGASELGRALETILQPCANLEIATKHFQRPNVLLESPAILTNLVARLRPSLVLLCISAENAEDSETMLTAIREKCQGLAVISILK